MTGNDNLPSAEPDVEPTPEPAAFEHSAPLHAQPQPVDDLPPAEDPAPAAEHHALAVPEARSHELAIPEQHHELAVPARNHHVEVPQHNHTVEVPEDNHAIEAPEDHHAVEVPEADYEVEVQEEQHAGEPAAQLGKVDVPQQHHYFEVPEQHETSAGVTEPREAPPATPETPAVERHAETQTETAQPQPAEPPAKSGAPRTVGFDRSVEERKQRAEQHWQHVMAAQKSGETLQGTVTTAVKGGLLVDVGGVRGFLPASQTRLEAGATVESLLKTKVPLRVLDVDEKRRRIVVSHRRALDDQRRTKRNELLRSLKIGQRHEGTVVRLAPFGAFLDIGGVEGLVPMSELAFERVERVEDLLKVGDAVTVTILRIEEGGRKIGLSRKNALPDPLRDHAALLRPGNVVQGKVVGKDSRLEVEIAPGLVGSVRESDADPAQYEIGEAIEVAVRYIDRKNRRVVLTTLHGAAAALPRSTGFAPLGEELRRR